MHSTLEELQAEVLNLPAKDRAHLLDSLIASLDADSEAEAAWDALAASREAELDTGAVKAVAHCGGHQPARGPFSGIAR
jgi:Putative addiction module component